MYYRPNLCPFVHLECFGASDISIEDNLVPPFSSSNPANRWSLGVGGTSSILVKPRLDLRDPCDMTSLGNVVLRGVRAVTTLLADRRIVFLTSHERFLARYHRTEDPTKNCQRTTCGRSLNLDLLPTITTMVTQMMMAIIPPFDNSNDPSDDPDAPPSVPPSPDASPPDCSGVVVAREAKNEETELADIAGVNETNNVGATEGDDVMELCAITLVENNRFKIKLRRIARILTYEKT